MAWNCTFTDVSVDGNAYVTMVLRLHVAVLGELPERVQARVEQVGVVRGAYLSLRGGLGVGGAWRTSHACSERK
jgi:hypothetical protein